MNGISIFSKSSGWKRVGRYNTRSEYGAMYARLRHPWRRQQQERQGRIHILGTCATISTDGDNTLFFNMFRRSSLKWEQSAIVASALYVFQIDGHVLFGEIMVGWNKRSGSTESPPRVEPLRLFHPTSCVLKIGMRPSGNQYPAWAFVEAANFAVRYNPLVKRYYQRKEAQRNTCVATKAADTFLVASINS